MKPRSKKKGEEDTQRHKVIGNKSQLANKARAPQCSCAFCLFALPIAHMDTLIGCTFALCV